MTPSNALTPDVLAALAGVDLRARAVVEGLMNGHHRSPQQGASLDFAQHRPYVAGDDPRQLDWKVYGRSDKLYLKQYRQETNLDLVLLVDCSGSMGYGGGMGKASGAAGAGKRGEPLWTKWDHAAALAGSLAYLALRQQDRVGLTLFADDEVESTRLSGSSTQATDIARRLDAAQLVAEPSVNPLDPDEATHTHTDLARIADRASLRLTRKSLIVLISDLFDDPDHLERGLARLHHRGHDVLVLQVMDRTERDFGLRGNLEFCGLEGEGRLPLDPAALRAAYREVVAEHSTRLREVVRRFGYDHLLLTTDEPLGPALRRFLARRSALISRGGG
ncbi:MAG: DUF58 domain-containing protein [Algisphaera sp.]